MFLTGFADEASHDLRLQIQATKELGWKHIEIRLIGKKFMGMLSDAEFDEAADIIEDSGIKINCYGSGVANWSRDPRFEQDFAETKQELLNAIPRMKRLGIKLIRGMSFKRVTDEQFDSPGLERIIFRKVGELVKICEDNGIIYGHENCANYAGQSYKHTLKLLENVNSPNLRLIFDTGNPVSTRRRFDEEPYPFQSTWEFYSNVKEFIEYVHIKDGIITSVDENGKVSLKYTYAGEGAGDVRMIVTDLLENGYDGGFSMEPHLAVIFHEKDKENDLTEKAKRMYSQYLEYGRRFEKLLNECKIEIKQ